MIDVTQLLVALPGERDFVVRVPDGELGPRRDRRRRARPPLRPASVSDPPCGLRPHPSPTGNTERVGQGRDRSDEMLERIGCPVRGTLFQARPGPGQRVLFGEFRSQAVLVRA